MADGPLHLFAHLSRAITTLVADAAPRLVAIRVGPNRHISGFFWSEGILVTVDQALPAQDTYSVVLSHGGLARARPGARDAAANLAILRVDATAGAAPFKAAGAAAVGALALALGAGPDGGPTARITTVHRLRRGGTGGSPAIVLDLPAARAEEGGPVLDAAGRLIGMAMADAAGETIIAPYDVVAGLCGRQGESCPVPASPAAGNGDFTAPNLPNRGAPGTRRGWLGVALQPITVPEALAERAGQPSGRMVVSLTQGGPAARAGLRVGDVLLSLNGHNATGPHALRAFLGEERIGTEVEVRLLRDGTIHTTYLTVEAQPVEADGSR